jgi:hypothetical protein
MNWRRLIPSFGVVASLAISAGAGLIAIRFVLAAINDGKCKARCTVSLNFAALLEDYRRVKGSYPVTTDAAMLKAELLSGAPDSKRFITDIQVLFESDGRSYRLAVFPNDYEYAGGSCGCLVLADRKIIAFPAALSTESRERIASTLKAWLQER